MIAEEKRKVYSIEYDAEYERNVQLRKELAAAERVLNTARKKFDKLDKACTKSTKRIWELRGLLGGYRPYLYAEAHSGVHYGDTPGTERPYSYLEQKVAWWTPEEAIEFAKSRRTPFIVELDADVKTWKALLYLNENAEIPIQTARKLLKLPAIEVTP